MGETKWTTMSSRAGNTPEDAFRNQAFDQATLLGRGGPLSSLGKIPLILLGLACLFAAVGFAFVLLRLIFQPYLVGGPSWMIFFVLIATPLIVALVYFGVRTLQRAAHHGRHGHYV